METQKNTLSLKWGTLKSWKFESSETGLTLLKEYGNIGSSISAMCQKDNDRQKEIICELIDLCTEDTILLEWYDKYVSKDEAKNYVMTYGKK